jgi:iron complex outermembrane receptor protein
MLKGLGFGLGLALLASQASAEGIETVTVTAEKRPESVLNVGINVTALSAQDIKASRIEDATDIATQIPNVNVKTNIPGAQQIISIRGVGLDDFSSTNNSSVGVYVDDVFLASFAENDFDFFDVDRIEVLKGPQGTLYGRNSTAGAIDILSAKPNLDGYAANVDLGYGDYEAFDAQAWVNVPVNTDLALRFSASTEQQGEGYWFSRVLDRDLGRQDVFRGRAQALWKPAEGLSVLLKVEGEHSDSEIAAGKFFGTISTNGEPCPDFNDPSHCVNAHGYTDTTADPFKGDWEHLSPYKADKLNTTLRIDDELGFGTLTSVTGYIDFKRGFYIDADAGPTTDAEFDQNDKVHQFSQEFRLTGSGGGFDYVAGAYYSWDRVQTYTPGFLTDSFGTDVLITADQTTKSAAAFGQVKYHITDKVNVTGGLRFTDERRHYTGGTTDLNPTGFSVLCFITPGCPFGTPGPYPLSSIPNNIPGIPDRIANDNLSWRTAVNWNPTDDTLLYASISRGTKSGGYFNGITTNSFALAPYKPERLTDFEAGVKSSLIDHRLFVDSSAFYYDYRDLQAQTFTSVGAVSLIKLGNIPTASVYGLDLDATWVPIDDFSLRAGLGLIHSRLGAFSVGVPVPAGNKLPDAPDVTFNATARYQHALWDDYVGAIQFGAEYGSSVYMEALNTPYLAGGAHWDFDGRLSVAAAEGRWEVALWGKNITNERHVIQATDDGIGMGYRIFNNPQTFGIEVSKRFE